MRASNHGEGGIFALLALLPERLRVSSAGRLAWPALLVMFGAGLLYGDGMITPAISVLSAIEGLEAAAPALHPLVVPLTCAVLAGPVPAAAPRDGRAWGASSARSWRCGSWSSASLGARRPGASPAGAGGAEPVARARASSPPTACAACSCSVPWSWRSPAARRSTPTWGTSARAPSAAPGSLLVIPSLVLSYLGQGALLAGARPTRPTTPSSRWSRRGLRTLGLVVLSTAATIIASQALISGAFSMTHQAVAARLPAAA